MKPTPAQLEAISARGNVLVVAGAGTGKTRTLVDRCLHCLLEEKPPPSLDEILMVTFTEAAAAEMRQRIRQRLEEERARQPDNPRWHEQLALFDTAHIGTLHGFCLQLVRGHFYERGLELDPQLTVMSEEEARLLADETLDTMLRSHYGKQDAAAEAVQQLVQVQGRGWDKPVRALVLKVHYYAQTLPNPGAWLDEQERRFANPDPDLWREWLPQARELWRADWSPALGRLAPDNRLATVCSKLLNPGKRSSTPEELAAACDAVATGLKMSPGKSLEKFCEDAQFLASLSMANGRPDALAEDWNWARQPMRALVGLAREFGEAFASAKRELGALDFHDLEQFALRLLWDTATSQPTEIARQWQRKLRFVFVDEYQDINAAQDKIIEALSRTGGAANRFLVGDAKQSIYRFRLADPRIFQAYAEKWRGALGKSIPLQDNFRSRESILRFVNSFFGLVMRPELGGLIYGEEAKLHFGAPNDRQPVSAAADSRPAVEIHWLVTRRSAAGNGEESTEGATEVEELSGTEAEARLVASRLAELKRAKHPVWDETARDFRPADWRDMAVLLRSPAAKAETYAKEFARLGVPLVASRRGFYASLEVMDWLNVLQLLDNPLQDAPLLGVLRSPLVGLTLEELAAIRLAALKERFWTALRRWHEAALSRAGESATVVKVAAFLERFARWRRLARRVSLSRCLETALAETHYQEWLLTQPRGQQRHANLRRLADLARQFDQFQRQGLFRFLRFVEAQQAAESEPEIPGIGEENAVRLMSIHQSKGLEFPLVVLADLGKGFNFLDTKAEVILDDEYGLCPLVRPPRTGRRYPSLPYWLASRRQRREILGEELRLLYVAMTRARDTLILTATVSEKKLASLAGEEASSPTAARNSADWVSAWFAQNGPSGLSPGARGETEMIRWWVHDGTGAGINPDRPEVAEMASALLDAHATDTLRTTMAWEYPFPAATSEPAKRSVSALRRLIDEEAAAAALPLNPGPRLSRIRGSRHAAEIGTAHHRFFQFVSLERLHAGDSVRDEMERMTGEQRLTSAEAGLLNLAAIADFWKSPLGREILVHRGAVQRELAFTARFTPAELTELAGVPAAPGLEDEFVVVQGVADLAVVLPNEIRIVDFKTDAINLEEIEDRLRRYEPQLRLYSKALERVYGRPVTKRWLHFLALRESREIRGWGVQGRKTPNIEPRTMNIEQMDLPGFRA